MKILQKRNVPLREMRENRKKRLQKTAKIRHRNEQIARTFKWFTGCVKFDKEKKLCNNCAEIRETRLVYSRKG